MLTTHCAGQLLTAALHSWYDLQAEEHRDEMLALNTLCPGGFPLIGNLLKSRSPLDIRIRRVRMCVMLECVCNCLRWGFHVQEELSVEDQAVFDYIDGCSFDLYQNESLVIRGSLVGMVFSEMVELIYRTQGLIVIGLRTPAGTTRYLYCCGGNEDLVAILWGAAALMVQLFP